jgi:hypothetical protein
MDAYGLVVSEFKRISYCLRMAQLPRCSLTAWKRLNLPEFILNSLAADKESLLLGKATVFSKKKLNGHHVATFKLYFKLRTKCEKTSP